MALIKPRLCALCATKPTNLSLAMHSSAFNHLSLKYTYVAVDTDDTNFVISAMRKMGIRGYSLSIPHKEIAVNLLDEISDEVKHIGACNTVINDGEKLSGYNTDVYGIDQGFTLAGADLNQKDCLILGSGGAARAFIYHLLVSNTNSITIANRTKQKAESVAKEFSMSPISNTKIGTIEFENIDPASYAVIINTTPIGSHILPETKDQEIFDYSLLSPSQTVFEAVTNDTKLSLSAKEKGSKTIDGTTMLLHQAVKQFELFTGGEKAPVEIMQKALLEEMGRG